MAPSKLYKVTSFSIKLDLYNRLKLRLPRHGDRSLALSKLVEKFLANEVRIEIQTRRL